MEPKIEYLKEEELLAVFEYCLKVLNEDRKRDHRGGRGVTGELNTKFHWPGWVGSRLEWVQERIGM